MQAELVRRAQAGDRDAFDALATASYDRMYVIARRVLRDSAAAEDAVQEALIKIWRDLRSLREIDRYDAWSNRLLVRACHDQSRRTRRMTVEVGVIDLDPRDPRDDYASVGHRDELERAFVRLTIEQRAVVVLTHYQGMSASDVGEVLGIPVGTVYSRLHYALRALRSAIGDQSPPVRAGKSPETVR
jgi:RNA polymerase sigma-70 factor (ECF subfamily)